MRAVNTWRKGRYGSPEPVWALHIADGGNEFWDPRLPRSRMNSSTRVDFPAPASPAIKATCKCPSVALFRDSSRSCSSFFRPIKVFCGINSVLGCLERISSVKMKLDRQIKNNNYICIISNLFSVAYSDVILCSGCLYQ